MADREPASTDERLSDVNPGTMPLDDHAQHDRWLIVRAASHDTDLTAAETADARALLARCDECAALSADITTITLATASSLAPARPRDFRLTSAEAASARGGVMERLGRWLASPGASVLRPLAGASLAIGIVLVAVGPSIQGPLQPPVQPPSVEAGAASPAQGATADPVLMMEMQPADPTADPATFTQTGPDNMADRSYATNAAGSEPVAKATADPQVADIQAVPGSTAVPETGDDAAIATSRSPTSDDTSLALVLLGIVLAGTGILVLLLTWLARRMTRDPLLPG